MEYKPFSVSGRAARGGHDYPLAGCKFNLGGVWGPRHPLVKIVQ